MPALLRQSNNTRRLIDAAAEAQDLYGDDELERFQKERVAMSEPTLACPKCGTDIKLTEAMAAPVVAATEKRYQDLLAQKDDDIQRRESTLREERQRVAEWERNLKTQVDQEVLAQVKDSEETIRAEETKKAKAAAEDVVNAATTRSEELRDELDRKDAKLAEAQKGQAELLRKQREFDEKERELELTVEKKIQDGLSAARASAQQDAEERIGLKVREKEETISSMAKQIEELRRKAEQGSQQLQGEVLELELEEALKAQFPDDAIEPVPKGVHGGDIVQRVGPDHGVILWESKRTKTWSNTWLPKLREDQREAKADIAIIVSTTLPKDMETDFDIIDGVWVCGPKVALALAAVMRDGLSRVAAAKVINAGMETKAEMIYQYLTGSQFKRRVEAIVEAFSTMKEDLDKERRAITKQWTKRETQIERVMQATVGMYGDMQGIAGAAIHEVDGLEMKALEA